MTTSWYLPMPSCTVTTIGEPKKRLPCELSSAFAASSALAKIKQIQQKLVHGIVAI